MPASLNKVFISGRLTRDPELRYTPSGRAVATLRLASNQTYTTQAGERKEDICYVNVSVWGRPAENCSEYLKKGSQIIVDGRLQFRSWETEDGQKRSAMDIVARRVIFLAAPREAPSEEEEEEEEIEDQEEQEEEEVEASEEEVPDVPF